jgi:chloride channel 7
MGDGMADGGEALPCHEDRRTPDRRRLIRRRNTIFPASSSGGTSPMLQDVLSRNFSKTLSPNPVSLYLDQVTSAYTPRAHRFESIDFRTASSQLNRDTLYSKSEKEERVRNLTAHGMVVCAGVAVGMLAFCNDQATKWCQIGIYSLTRHLVEHHGVALGATAFVSCSGICLAISAGLCVYWCPVAEGSAIPEMKSYLNGVHIPGLLSMRALIAKSIALVFALGGGILSGKQGPMNHIGAIVGAAISQGASTRMQFRVHSKMYRPFRTEESKRDFAAIGSAIGVAVAFGAPIGAILWALEEAVTHWSQPLTWITSLGCLVGSLTTGMMSNLVRENGLFLPSGPLASQTQKMVENPSILDAACFIILGVLGGVFGIVLPAVARMLTLFRYRFVNTPHRKFIEAVAVGILTAAVRFCVAFTRRQCGTPNLNMEDILKTVSSLDFSGTACTGDSKSSLASVILNPLVVSLRVVLHLTDPAAISATNLVVSLGFFSLITVSSHGIGVPYGLFGPLIVIGGLSGRLMFLAINAVSSDPGRSIRMYAFVGAAASLGGVSRLSVSTTVWLLEAARVSTTFGLPCFLAAYTAKFIGDCCALGIFDQSIVDKGLPYFASQILKPHLYNQVSVGDIMSPRVVAVQTQSTVGELLDTLRTHTHNAFPVFAKTIAPDDGACNDAINAQNDWDCELRVSREFSKDRAVRPFSTTEQEPSQPRIRKQMSTPAMVALVASRTAAVDDRKALHSSFSVASDPANLEKELHTSTVGGVEHLEMSAHSISLGKSVTPEDIGSADQRALDGVVARADLVAIIDHCIGCIMEDPIWDWDSHALTRENFDSAWPHGEYIHRESEILAAVPTELRDISIDLTRFCDANPLLISDAATAAEARTLFRMTGARHALAIYTRRGRVVGIVTRTDLLEESIEDILRIRGSREIRV